MILLQSQKNELFDIIIKNGFSPTQFEINDIYDVLGNKETNTVMKCKGYDYFFKFYVGKPTISEFSPGETTHTSKFLAPSWAVQQSHFSDWLTYLKREISIPDKWAMLQSESYKFKLPNSGQNDFFTYIEIETIRLQFIHIKSELSLVGLPSVQLNIINEKLDFLIESTKTMKRFDWRSLFIGTILQTILNLGLTPETLTRTIDLFRNYFNSALALLK